MSDPIKAEHRIVTFFDGLGVEGYRMPSGEFRIGLASASRVIGYTDDWLRRSIRRSGRTVKDLRGLGFSEDIQKVAAQSSQGNLLDDSTISLRDFNRLIAYATYKGKKAALALQIAGYIKYGQNRHPGIANLGKEKDYPNGYRQGTEYRKFLECQVGPSSSIEDAKNGIAKQIANMENERATILIYC